jgi:hypothetical protein
MRSFQTPLLPEADTFADWRYTNFEHSLKRYFLFLKVRTMEDKPNNRLAPSRPKDKSLEAYKAWITELVSRLTTNNEIQLTEQEWIAHWKEYWKEHPSKR